MACLRKEPICSDPNPQTPRGRSGSTEGRSLYGVVTQAPLLHEAFPDFLVAQEEPSLNCRNPPYMKGQITHVLAKIC